MNSNGEQAPDYAVILRAGRCLRANGRLPDVKDCTWMVPIVSHQHAMVVVVTSFTGQPPDHWEWLPVVAVQEGLCGPLSDTVAEALLEAA